MQAPLAETDHKSASTQNEGAAVSCRMASTTNLFVFQLRLNGLWVTKADNRLSGLARGVTHLSASRPMRRWSGPRLDNHAIDPPATLR